MDEFKSQQLIGGKLVDVQESCVSHAIRTFKKREKQDTNPTIVQMVKYGERLPHWYYRSDEHIDQPFLIASLHIFPYVGPRCEITERDPNRSLAEFVVDEVIMRMAQNKRYDPFFTNDFEKNL